jgi:hypothetical protein
MELGPDPINFSEPAAVRDRKACEGAVHYAMKRAGHSDTQAHNGIRTYRSAVLEEAAVAIVDPASRAVLLSMAARARSERTYGDVELGDDA